MSKYTRGTTVKFEVNFLDTEGDPTVPYNALYPQISIYDPNGTIVASGVGIQTSTPGKWEFEYSIAAGAELSTNWRVEWVMLDLSRESFTQLISFEIVDQLSIPSAFDREASYLVMPNKSERLIYKCTSQPYELTLTIRKDRQDWYVFPAEFVNNVFADGYWNYYADTPRFTDTGLYLVVWEVRPSLLASMEQIVQHLRVTPDQFWEILPYLRGLLDKLRKVQDTPLSYTDNELYQYMERGLDFLNSVHPMTNWVFGGVPASLTSWWVLLSGWWALNARQLLEIEVSHEFSGQQVNLSYDHASPLGEVISRWESLVWDRLVPYKLSMYRASAGPGIVSVRPYRGTVDNRVYRMGTSSNVVSELPGMLSVLGI